MINSNHHLSRRTLALPLAVWFSRNLLQGLSPGRTGQIIVIVWVCIVSLYPTCSCAASPWRLWPLGPEPQMEVGAATWKKRRVMILVLVFIADSFLSQALQAARDCSDLVSGLRCCCYMFTQSWRSRLTSQALQATCDRSDLASGLRCCCC